MSLLTMPMVARADAAVQRMSLAQRVALADEIHAAQPNLLASVLVHARLGATMEQLDVLIHCLLVTWVAMKESKRGWPLVTEAVQERCLARVAGKVRFIEGLPPAALDEAVRSQTLDHPEVFLLAFVMGTFKDRGLAGIRTEVEKGIMLSALNLVECVAVVAAFDMAARTS